MKSNWRKVTVAGKSYRYTTFNSKNKPIGVLAKHHDGDLFLSPLVLARAFEQANTAANKLYHGCKPGVWGSAIVAEAIKLKLADMPVVVRQKKGKKK